MAAPWTSEAVCSAHAACGRAGWGGSDAGFVYKTPWNEKTLCLQRAEGWPEGRQQL